jgi:preprotein translocase subunit SecG
MLWFVTTIHVLLCLVMIGVILLQPGKDAGMGSALGGGAASSAFGGRGAVTFLTKMTAVCAVLFFMTSLGLSFVGMKSSVMEGVKPTPAKPALTTTPGAPSPVAPGAPRAPGGPLAPREPTPVEPHLPLPPAPPPAHAPAPAK